MSAVTGSDPPLIEHGGIPFMTTAAHPAHADVTTLDLLKCAAVLLMFADHVGLYFFDNAWLRVAGRPVAVIFGFLIGYSASARVPASWIILGLGLSLLSRALFPADTPHTLDILITLALTRLTMPFFERLHRAQPLLLVPAVGLLALLTVPMNEFLEYGSEVPIVALLGLAVRLDRGRSTQTAVRHATALAALVAIGLTTLDHFEFTGPHAAACIALLAGTMLALASFRTTPIAAPPTLAPLIRWTGRNTLLIYAAHMAVMQLTAWAILPESAGASASED